MKVKVVAVVSNPTISSAIAYTFQNIEKVVDFQQMLSKLYANGCRAVSQVLDLITGDW